MAHGAELLEVDVRRTRDGAVVLSHDRGLRRQAGLDRDLAQLDYQVRPQNPRDSPQNGARGKESRSPRV